MHQRLNVMSLSLCRKRSKNTEQERRIDPDLERDQSCAWLYPCRSISGSSETTQRRKRNVYVSKSQLFGLASFYDMLSTKPRGRHVIKFCENAPCHVVGGKAVWDSLCEALDLKNGETTARQKMDSGHDFLFGSLQRGSGCVDR